MRTRTCHLLSLACLLGAASLGRADFLTIDNPYASMPNSATPYLTATTLAPIGGTNATPAITGGLSIALSGSPQMFSAGDWGAWGTPPNAEVSNPAVLFSNGTPALTLTFGHGVSAFGLEADSNYYGTHQITTTFYNGTQVLGAITRSIVDGRDPTDTFDVAATQLFAAQVTGATPSITSVQVTSDVDFAVAQFRYASAPIAAVPEPSSCLLALTCLGCTGVSALWKRRRNRDARHEPAGAMRPSHGLDAVA